MLPSHAARAIALVALVNAPSACRPRDGGGSRAATPQAPAALPPGTTAPPPTTSPLPCTRDADCPRLACGPCRTGDVITRSPMPSCTVNPCPDATAVCRQGVCVVR